MKLCDLGHPLRLGSGVRDGSVGRDGGDGRGARVGWMVLARVLSFPLAFSPSSPAWRKLAGSELLRRLRQDRCCMILYGLRMLGAAPIQRAILPPEPQPETFAKPAFRPRKTRWRG